MGIMRWVALLVGVRGALVGLVRPRRWEPPAEAPDGWPPPGSATLALGTADGVWRVHLGSGQAHRVSAEGEPVLEVALVDDRLVAMTGRARRETRDWRTWRLSWDEPHGAATAGAAKRLGWWDADGGAAEAVAPAGSPRFARTDSGRAPGGGYVVTGGRRGRDARLYHLDAAGTRRLIASCLPRVHAMVSVPADSPLAGPPAPVTIRPRPC